MILLQFISFMLPCLSKPYLQICTSPSTLFPLKIVAHVFRFQLYCTDLIDRTWETRNIHKILGEGGGEITFRCNSGHNPVAGFGVNDVTLLNAYTHIWNARRKMPLEIHFMYEVKKKLTAFFKHATESIFYFPQTANYITISSFLFK